jgi:uncharacterized protein YndB with AHSA1/START domain
MENMNFSVDINASKEKVWDALWEDASYRDWTSAFMEGSYAVTDNWKEGTKVLFLDPKGSGMVSMVAENKPHEFMSFKHLGEVIDGIEDTTSDKVKQWSGAFENYTLTDSGGGTHLEVDMGGNLSEDFKAYFTATWPKALQKLKEIAEEK